MTQPRSRPPRRPSRAAVALALAALLAAPLGLTPEVAARSSAATRVPAAETAAGTTADLGGTSTDPVAVDAPPDPLDQGPSAHYRQAVEHATDVIEFAPGERVAVPFSPRDGDEWEVDGTTSRMLPAGFASGRQLRDAPDGKAWAVAVPSDVAAPWHFGGLGERFALPPLTGHGRGTDAGATLASAVLPPEASSIEAAPVSANGLRREVFGFLPYWELGARTTVLDWRVLSTVAYFSVGCMSNGNLLKRNADGSISTGWAGWTSSRMTSLIDAAHAHHTRVVLTITCFAWSTGGAATQAALLGSAAARARLARQVAAAVRDRGADGVNLDFEPIVAGYADEFTRLVRSIRAELQAIAPGYQLTFDTMATIGNQPIVEATAPGGADAVLVMGYDYRRASSRVAGSIAPLSGPEYDLTDTVAAYTTRISPSKVILGVPWYGRAWSTPSDDPHARNISGTKYGGVAEPTYAQAYDLLAAYGRRWDSVEQAPWTAYRKRTCTPAYGCVTSWRELYVDDAASLKLRYDLVNRIALRGAGIWALGFDDGHPELRAALANKFLTDRTAPVTGIVTLPPWQRDEGFRVAWTSYDDSAIRGYDVHVSIDGGPWTAWLRGTTATSSIYLGSNGHVYAFRVRATDVHGNASAWRTLPLGSLGTPRAITVGGFATVRTDGLRLRAAPSTSAAIMTRFEAGDALRVIGGPSTSGGYTWYEVAGPVRQWGPVDALQVGGWVAAHGNGSTNVAPRSPVYATRIDAGITGMRLNDGADRVLTPNGDGANDTLRVVWTNRRELDSLALRVFRADGNLVGERAVGAAKLTNGAHAYAWDGRLGGSLVPLGTYVIQLRGTSAGTTYNAASGSPVSATQLARWGVIVSKAAATAVTAFSSTPASPTSARSATYNVTFGGPVKNLAANDFSRSGTAAGCSVGSPTGAGATWKVAVTGCGPGTLVLSLRGGAVMDVVSNWGPESRVNAPNLLFDRTVPTTAAPKVALRSGAALASSLPTTGLLATLAWSARDPGGAGIAGFDIRRSQDGDTFTDLAIGVPAASLAISLAPGHAYRFAVRARDRAGNVGAWSAGQTVRASLLQEGAASVLYTGPWRTGENSQYSAWYERSATSAGAAAKLSFTGRGIAWVTTRGPDRGAVRVYLDGDLVATIDTHAPALGFRYVAWSRIWASGGTHTLRLVVVGSAGHPRVDIDAFEVLR